MRSLGFPFIVCSLVLAGCSERASRDAFLQHELSERDTSTMAHAAAQNGSGGMLMKVACPMYIYDSGSWVYTGGTRWVYADGSSSTQPVAKSDQAEKR